MLCIAMAGRSVALFCALVVPRLLRCVTWLIGSGVVFLTEEKRRRKYSNSGYCLIREPVHKDIISSDLIYTGVQETCASGATVRSETCSSFQWQR